MQFDFDLIQFLLRGGELAPAVIFVTLAFTYVAGQFGLAGKGQLAFSLVLGAALGGGLSVAASGVPVDFPGWFALIVYAGVMAVTPSRLYEMGKGIVDKALGRAFILGEDDEVEHRYIDPYRPDDDQGAG